MSIIIIIIITVLSFIKAHFEERYYLSTMYSLIGFVGIFYIILMIELQ